VLYRYLARNTIGGAQGRNDDAASDDATDAPFALFGAAAGPLIRCLPSPSDCVQVLPAPGREGGREGEGGGGIDVLVNLAASPALLLPGEAAMLSATAAGRAAVSAMTRSPVCNLCWVRRVESDSFRRAVLHGVFG
jgi:hypothetical protein